MKPITFNGYNALVAKDQKEYGTLPAAIFPPEAKGNLITAVSCWKLTFWERVKILFTGKIWHINLFRSNYPPVFMSTKQSEVITLPEDYEQPKTFPL